MVSPHFAIRSANTMLRPLAARECCLDRPEIQSLNLPLIEIVLRTL